MSNQNVANLTVSAAFPNQRLAQARVGRLTSKQIRDLLYGNKVSLYVQDQAQGAPSLVFDTKLPLGALIAFSPVIGKAVQRHNRITSRSGLDSVVLPKGDVRAYRELVVWIKACIDTGRLVPIRRFYKRPLTRCTDLIVIANPLKLDHLKLDLEGHTARILIGSPQFAYTLNPADIRYAFTETQPGHRLRRSVARGVAITKAQGYIHPKFRLKLQELETELPEFAGMLNEVVLT